MEPEDAARTAGTSAYATILASTGDALVRVDALLDEHLQDPEEPLIAELARHLIDAGGKRLRPLLTIAVARDCGYRGAGHIGLAAAVELIHSATLLHDDVVDGSRLRRGRTGANTLWGNKVAVLVGDYLLSCSFRLMVESGSPGILRVLADAASVIARGEVMQLSSARSLDTCDDRYLAVVEAKTAALFRAAADVGARIAEAGEATIAAYAAYGRALGIAFQLADDALDYGGQEQQTGKSVGDDFNEGKATLPALLAYRRGDATARAFWHRTIHQGERNPGDLETALRQVAATNACTDTLAIARNYAREACAALDTLPASPVRDALGELATFAAVRQA